jgi:hypothetical protein
LITSGGKSDALSVTSLTINASSSPERSVIRENA